MFNLSEFIKHNPYFFVTGTDTEVGKTYCSSLMIKAANTLKQTIQPYKPIAAGAELVSGILVNEDAQALYEASNGQFPLTTINPLTLAQPIAPHIAAKQAGLELTINTLNHDLSKHVSGDSPCLVEGAGGWLLPLNEQQLMSQWVAEKKWPVVMVVGVKLGCLNHALLTAQAIDASGCKLVGWVANFIEGETGVSRQNVEYLESQISAPKLFDVAQNQEHVSCI